MSSSFLELKSKQKSYAFRPGASSISARFTLFPRSGIQYPYLDENVGGYVGFCGSRDIVSPLCRISRTCLCHLQFRTNIFQGNEADSEGNKLPIPALSREYTHTDYDVGVMTRSQAAPHAAPNFAPTSDQSSSYLRTEKPPRFDKFAPSFKVFIYPSHCPLLMTRTAKAPLLTNCRARRISGACFAVV